MPGQPLNVLGVNDPKLTEMITLQRRTLDVAKRRQIVYDIQRYLAEQAFIRSERLGQGRLGLGSPHQELHAEQRVRLRRPNDGRLDRQIGVLDATVIPVQRWNR
jgi:hypothetical protein